MNIGYIHAMNDRCSAYIAQERSLINLHCEKIFINEGNYYDGLLHAINTCTNGDHIHCLALDTMDMTHFLKTSIRQLAKTKNIDISEVS